MKFCTECGAPLAENNKFCANCGARIEPQSTDTPSETSEEPLTSAGSAAAAEPPKKDMSGLPPAWMPPPVQTGSGVRLESGQSKANATAGDDTPADTTSVSSAPAWMPPPVKSSFGGSVDDRPSGLSGVDEDWKMSDLGPPPPPKRRLWIWIPLGVIAAVILCCLIFTVLSETVLEDTFDRISTEVATDATEEAVEP